MLSALPTRNRGSYLDRYQTLQLSTNLFKVNFKQDTKIYIYSFKTQPEIPRQNVKKVRALLMSSRSIVERLIGPYAISGRTVFGSKSQQMGKGAELNFKVEFEGSSFQAIFRLAREVAMGDIYSADIHKSGVVYAFLNNMLKNFFHQLDYTEIGKSRKYFDSKNYKNLEGAKVTVFKGYSSNFTLLESGLYLRMDPAVKIVRGETVLQVINNIYKLNGGLSKSQRRLAVEAELVGKMVMANYGKNRYYIIDSIIFDTLIDGYTFNNGKENVNLIQYYKDTYDIEVESKKQPLVKAAVYRKEKENDGSIMLVPQLLLMSGLPDDFDERKRREISDTTIVSPAEKARQISSIFQRFCQSGQNFNPNLVADKLGIKLETTPTKITAKQFNLPELQLGGKQKIDQNKSTNFQLFNKALYNSGNALKVAVLCPSDLDLSTARSLFNSTSANLGLQCKLEQHAIRYNQARQALRSIEQVVQEELGKGVNMFWFIIPPSFKNSYSSVKKIVLKDGVEVNSQVTLTSTLQKKGVQSVLTKILLQMAAKVGNKLWVPKVPQKMLTSGVMMVGLESYADQADKTMNVLSFCSNTNKEFSSFYSNYLRHPKNDNSKTYMKNVIFQCLNQYIVANKTSPHDVIIIKNGSSKYDNRLLVQTEVAEIRQVFRSVVKNTDGIHLVYVLLDKDANQKFFAERGREMVNPSSGMLVNTDAVGKGFEFYLVAQHCNKGTVKPTFYKVLYSDTYLQQGMIEELLYTQCFNYMNWSGSIKVPSVVQYAKKLSMFVGQYIGSDCVSANLHNNLYYI